MKTQTLKIASLIKPIYALILPIVITLGFTSCDETDPDPCEGFEISTTRSDDDEITINFTEGEAPYNYVISYTGLDVTQSGTSSDATLTITTDEYAAATITVTDDNDCEATGSVEAGNPCNDSDLAATVERELDLDTGTDMLSFEITGGEVPYSYTITYEGNDTPQTGESEEGTFEIETTDFAAATVAVTDNIGCLESVTLEASPCNGFSLDTERNTFGRIVFAITGGSGPYRFSIAYEGVADPQTGVLATTNFEIGSISPNAAEITVLDANNCEAIASIGEDPCDGYEAAATGENSTISVTITAGTAPYDYSVAYADTSTPQTGSSDAREFDIEVNTTGKAATVTITDANGCEVTTNEVSAYDISSFVDTDGERYSYTEFNGLTWMTENYRGEYTGYKCYEDNSENCETYGGLYNWTMANADDIAPEGWRMPTRAEAQALLDVIEGDAADDAAALLTGGSTGLNIILSGRFEEGAYYGIEYDDSGASVRGHILLEDAETTNFGHQLSIARTQAIISSGHKTEDFYSIRFVKE